MARVIAYVDGFNLYYGMKKKYGRKYLWLNLVDLVCRLRPEDDISVVRYFTAVVRGEPEAAANQTDYLHALAAHNGPLIDIRLARFKPRKIGRCRQCAQPWLCSCPKEFRSYEEKETDVALAVAMVEDTAAQVSDVTLLISADSDFAPATAAAKRINPAQPVILAMPPGNLQPHRRFTDIGHFNINETALRNSQLSEHVMNAADGKKYTRPTKWV